MDLSKIKERLDSFNKQSKPSGTKRIWKPEPGQQVVRIVPYIHDRDWPFLELYFYYEFGKRTIISPQNFGDPDPVQELADKLKATGEKEDWLLARKIEAKMRTYVPILVRGQEQEGVKFWGFGKTVYEELLKTIDDPDYGDITDLKTGSDLTIEYEQPKDGYPKTSFRVKRTPTPATTDPAVMQLLKDMPTVSDIWEVPTYDELAKMLDSFINNTDDDSSETDVVSNSGNTDSDANIQDLPSDFYSPEIKSSTRKMSVPSDIDAAFDEMFA